jgi:hypothetical protein
MARSCVDWVVWRVGLVRSTAKEKLRVAHEIRRRAIVRDAFEAEGRFTIRGNAPVRLTFHRVDGTAL